MMIGYRLTCNGKIVGTFLTPELALAEGRRRCPGRALVQPVEVTEEEAFARTWAAQLDAFTTALRELRAAILRAFGRNP